LTSQKPSLTLTIKAESKVSYALWYS